MAVLERRADVSTELKDAALTDARAALAEALAALFAMVASTEVDEPTRRHLDTRLCEHAADLKGALFKALKECRHHRAFLGLPGIMEETRRERTAT